MTRFCLYLVALLVPAAPASSADEKPYRPPLQEADIERLLGEHHFGMYLRDDKVGWGRIAVEKVGGEEPLLRFEMKMQAAFVVFGVRQQFEFTARQDFDAKAPYAFRGGLSRQSDGEDAEEVRVTRAGNGLSVVVRSGEEEVKKRIPAIDHTLADAVAVDVWVARGAKAGDRITTGEFDFDRLEMTPSTHLLKGEKTTLAEGVKVTFVEVESTDVKEGLTTLSRYKRSDGRMVSMRVGGLFELRLEPEEIAKKTGLGADLFEQGTVKIDRKLGDPETIAALVLEVQAKGEPVLKSGPRQEVARDESGKVLVRLGKAFGAEVRATPEEIKEALAETTTYPITHPKVQKLAKQAVGDAKTDRQKIIRLTRFVNDFITPSYTAEPLNLLKLIQEKEGDCSEYALLFATLARAAGVPCREVSGVVYMGDEERAFGPHAWNEVVLDGKWVPVDASVPQLDVDPTHVRYGSTAGEGLLNLAASLEGMSFRLVEVKRR